MATIINIDTATDQASIALCRNGKTLATRQSQAQKEHASWVHLAIKDLLTAQQLSFDAIDAVAVTSGPGSYTGLRVAMATAKGLCFALQKPLIAINTLHVMAFAAKNELQKQGMHLDTAATLCAMLDARRMEVFTAVYNMNLEVLKAPQPLVLTKEALEAWIGNRPTYCFGNGSNKVFELACNNCHIIDVYYTAEHLGALSYDNYTNKQFADTVYAEPDYFKEFYTTVKIN